MSFAAGLRTKLCQLQPQKLCCRKALINGFLYTSGRVFDDGVSVSITGAVQPYLTDLLVQAYNVQPVVSARRGGGGAVDVYFKSKSAQKYIQDMEELHQSPRVGEKCSECGMYFLRGVYLACGYPSDPAKEFRMDFMPRYRAEELAEYFDEIGIAGHTTTRNGRKIIYFRSGERIGDVFAHLGLTDVYFEIQNEYFRRELNNLTNRQNNVTLRNIERSVESTGEQVRLIRRLKEEHLLSLLPEELIATAELRLAYEDYSLAQLAAVAVPAITKSGLNHRLKKIVEFARQHLK